MMNVWSHVEAYDDLDIQLGTPRETFTDVKVVYPQGIKNCSRTEDRKYFIRYRSKSFHKTVINPSDPDIVTVIPVPGLSKLTQTFRVPFSHHLAVEFSVQCGRDTQILPIQKSLIFTGFGGKYTCIHISL